MTACFQTVSPEVFEGTNPSQVNHHEENIDSQQSFPAPRPTWGHGYLAHMKNEGKLKGVNSQKLEYHEDNPGPPSNPATQNPTLSPDQEIQEKRGKFHTCMAHSPPRGPLSEISHSTGPSKHEGPRFTPHKWNRNTNKGDNLANHPPQSKRPELRTNVNSKIIALQIYNTATPAQGRDKGNNKRSVP